MCKLRIIKPEKFPSCYWSGDTCGMSQGSLCFGLKRELENSEHPGLTNSLTILLSKLKVFGSSFDRVEESSPTVLSANTAVSAGWAGSYFHMKLSGFLTVGSRNCR